VEDKYMRNLKTKLDLYIFLVPLLVVFFSETAFAYTGENADSWDYAFPIEEKCFETGSDGVPVGQTGGNFCMSNALKTADAEMNAKYKKLLSVLVEGKMLRDSQRAWLKFRNLECKLRTSGMGEGSATQYFVDSCNLDLTLKRIKDLDHLDTGSYCNGCPVRK
jgi:uncharacterized protein YecT (DUF1311 family)